MVVTTRSLFVFLLTLVLVLPGPAGAKGTPSTFTSDDPLVLALY